MIKTLFSYFRPHMKIFALDMFCAIMVAAVDLAFPLVSRKAMYDLLPGKEYRIFFILMVGVAVFYVLRSLCYYIMTYWGHTFGIRVEADIRAALFTHLQELDFEFYDKNRTGKLMNRLTGDLFEITELAHHGPEDLLISLLTIIGALICMFAIEWRLAIVVAILIPIFLMIVMKNRKEMSRASSNVKQTMAEINSEIESRISGIRTSKAFANEDVDQARFEVSNDVFKGAKKDFYKAMGRFNASQEFFMCIMPVAVIAFGGWLIMKGSLNYIDLITFTLFVSAFVNPIRKMSNFAEIFTNGTAGLKRFMEVMAVQPQVEEKPDAKVLLVVPASLLGNWKKEGAKFTPEMTVDILYGKKADTLSEQFKESSAFFTITTYRMACTIQSLYEREWDCIILDEAQAIKNPLTKQTKQLKTLKSRMKIALTGTPIENDLFNLWSIFDFLNKGLLGSSDEFRKFCRSLQDHPEGYAKLKNMIAPFMLRRVKTDKRIISDLPEKLYRRGDHPQ